MDIITEIKMRFKRAKEVEVLEVIEDRCVGCGSCVAKCKLNVFEMDTKNGVAVVANLANCKGCGKCVKKMCNFGAINLTLA